MRWVLPVLSFFLATLSGAQTTTTREFVGGKLAAPPTLDGKVEADEYKDAVRFDGLVDADTGAAFGEGGTFYLAYDDQNVYFAARLADARPSAIQATEFRTNVGLNGNDTVTLVIDPYDKLADFNRFTMNARGATNLQIVGGRAAKREWLGDFAAKGRITPEGWEVEARIPWSVMRLPGKGPHDLRFNVFRNFRRFNRTYAWAQTSNGLVQNNARWKTVDLPAGAPTPLQLLPYAYGGLESKSGIVANSGLDLRYSLNRDIDLVGTINPDFRNVERGVLSLDFSYFERLANETRPFFLEGGQYFGGGDDDGPNIFVPQRIGNFDLGAKAFGKLDPATDVGVLVTEDFGKQDAVVARVRRQTGPRSSWSAAYAGGGTDGERNDAVAGSYGLGRGLWYYSANLAAEHDDRTGSGHSGNLNAWYSKQRGFVGINYNEVSEKYNPRLGYAPQTDNRGFDSFGGNTWVLRRRGVMQYRLLGSAAFYRTYDLGKPYLESVGFYPSVTFMDGTRVGSDLTYERYFGGTDDKTYSVFVVRPDGDPYRRFVLSAAGGERGGFPYRDLSAAFAYRPLPTLQLNASLQKTTFFGITQDQRILSANYDLDQYHSVGGRVVSGPGISNFYVSFRQAGNRGAEYYVILGDPNATKFRASLIVKAVFPISVRV